MIYIKSVTNIKPVEERNEYPYNVPSIYNLRELIFDKAVTFIIGENGAGKSTLVESIAVSAGFNPEGGSRNFNFTTKDSHSSLFESIRLVRTPYRNKDGYFLRAESFYNVATAIERYQVEHSYGGSLHERSHGESFISLLHNRLIGNGLYIFDEPESALSLISQLNMLIRIDQLVKKQSQFIIATHSPILMAYPDADIYQVSSNGIYLVDYEDTDQYRLTKYFMNNREKMLLELGLNI